MFHSGKSIEAVSIEYWKLQRKLREDRQEALHNLREEVRHRKVENRKYKYTGQMIAVGPVVTKKKAYNHVEALVYKDYMQSVRK